MELALKEVPYSPEAIEIIRFIRSSSGRGGAREADHQGAGLMIKRSLIACATFCSHVMVDR
jgi:hypothetical protein